MSLPNRVWIGDLETAYQSVNPYTQLLLQLAAISIDLIAITNPSENWRKDANGDFVIEITYETDKTIHSIWTQRFSDYLNLDVLFLLNIQLDASFKFYYSPSEEAIYFISNKEKERLEENNVVFHKQGFIYQFDLILFNITQSIKLANNNFAYRLMPGLSECISEYEDFSQQRDISKARQLIKSNLLPFVDWEKALSIKVDMSSLHAFANRV